LAANIKEHMVFTALVSSGYVVSSIDFKNNGRVLAALKPDDTEQLKAKFGFDPKATFQVPQKTYDVYSDIARRGAKLEQEWDSRLHSYGQKYAKEYAELTRRVKGDLPDGWENHLPIYKPSDAATASRKLSEVTLTAISPYIPDLMGGYLLRCHEEVAHGFVLKNRRFGRSDRLQSNKGQECRGLPTSRYKTWFIQR
jgi:Transketolase, thiamine diphosphate binding domain